MSELEIGFAVLTISVLLFGAHVLGYIFEKMHQPRLIGEILAGVLLGPFVLGKVLPSAFQTLFPQANAVVNSTGVVLNFIYWLGLLFLMFISGSETRGLMAKENRRATAWIVGVGTPIPFFLVLALGLAACLPLDYIVGTAGDRTAALLIVSIAVAVTSIPVISRIFQELGILHTRFASLILGSSVIEDIILWAVLAIATALVGSATRSQQYVIDTITSHMAATLLYTGAGLFLAPLLLKKLHSLPWNLLKKASATGYTLFILFGYGAVAALLKVNLAFAAFLAGYGLVGGMSGSERDQFQESLVAVSKVALAIFIPLYFVMVGYKLIWGREFSLLMLAVFLLGSTLLCFLSVGFAAKLGGFRGLDILNITLVCNARGGPGIVLASIAYENGIINGAFYTTLVLTAIITSQVAGFWLKWVIRNQWPLLSETSKAV
ncbi:MAG TPA: cation:proton antiporter [Bacillota bacterium]|nr:cation:proton antiporter [Bacillota bacterium]